MAHRSLAARACALLLAGASLVAQGAPVDINSADAATLARELKGVGDNKAATIVEYRRTHGGFKTLDDLALVKGIGAKLVERNRSDLRLGRYTPGAGAGGASASSASSGRTVFVKAPTAATTGDTGAGGARGVGLGVGLGVGQAGSPGAGRTAAAKPGK